VRNFEPWREDDHRLTFMKELNEEALKGDVMKTLESRTEESKKEMDILDGLEEIKELNAKNAQLKTEEVIALKERRSLERMQRDEDDEVGGVKFGTLPIRRLQTHEPKSDKPPVPTFGPAKPNATPSGAASAPRASTAPKAAPQTPTAGAPVASVATPAAAAVAPPKPTSAWSALAEAKDDPPIAISVGPTFVVVAKKKDKQKKKKKR